MAFAILPTETVLILRICATRLMHLPRVWVLLLLPSSLVVLKQDEDKRESAAFGLLSIVGSLMF
jgi:hypothetical protein